MAIRTLTPPTSDKLISLSQVKLYLGETGTDRDTLLASLISDASSSMLSFLGVHPGRQRYQETGFGNGQVHRHLSRLPVEEGTLTTTLDDTAITDWTLADPATGLVYRETYWTQTAASSPNLVDTYYAGYLLPDQVSTWAASTAYTAGKFARPSSTSSPSLFRFECTTAGTSGSTEPTWPSVLAGTVLDGTTIWTARAVQELPAVVSSWCYAEVLRALSSLSRPYGQTGYGVEGVTESYSVTQTDRELGMNVQTGLIRFRKELGVWGVA